MKKNKTKRNLAKEIDALKAEVVSLKRRSNPNRMIGPPPGGCGVCGLSPCECEKSRKKFGKIYGFPMPLAAAFKLSLLKENATLRAEVAALKQRLNTRPVIGSSIGNCEHCAGDPGKCSRPKKGKGLGTVPAHMKKVVKEIQIFHSTVPGHPDMNWVHNLSH